MAAVINGWDWSSREMLQVQDERDYVTGLREAEPLTGRIVVVAPHPDDETLANGGMIADARLRGQEVFMIFMTAGDAFPWSPVHTARGLFQGGLGFRELGALRIQEALNATAALGVPADHVYFLGYPDRGLNALLGTNYLERYTSSYTQADAVPYDRAVRPGAPYTGVSWERQLRTLLERFKPDVLIGPGIYDFNADHAASAFMLARVSTAYPKARLYFTLVHGGLEWPVPKGLRPELPLVPPQALQTRAWQIYRLSPEARRRKQLALEAYRSQNAVMGRYLSAFVRANELLLPSPRP